MTQMKYEPKFGTVSPDNIDKLIRKIGKSLFLDDEVASALIYKEWEMVELLFEKHKKVKAVHKHLLLEIEGHYRGRIVCSN
ncbi:hypothetical protein [Sulfurovum sp.]|jgi:hypothetical protein|uniref:hypothetical protein n=1 Tax=Sulfurovum sp. TaxID=1969726 RepID=UPI002A371492|nr:hypothetical protein [Sulfurovum sp.]MDD2451578.1 hypothetical protein [Sulfurovum sp.]MDD3500737.1 hypothetical protein [Sulfurovum sp.]MDY0403730.1 hypothetical protein [Sulfurovum sp.]